VPTTCNFTVRKQAAFLFSAIFNILKETKDTDVEWVICSRF